MRLINWTRPPAATLHRGQSVQEQSSGVKLVKLISARRWHNTLSLHLFLFLAQLLSSPSLSVSCWHRLLQCYTCLSNENHTVPGPGGSTEAARQITRHVPPAAATYVTRNYRYKSGLLNVFFAECFSWCIVKAICGFQSEHADLLAWKRKGNTSLISNYRPVSILSVFEPV